jgi:hypothetical protein
MTNPYYNVSGAPTTGSAGLSSVMRGEFAAIAAAFALLPPLTPNNIVVVNSGGTALVGTTTLGTIQFTKIGIGIAAGAFPLNILSNSSSLQQILFSNTTSAGGVGIELAPDTGAVILEMLGSTAGGTTYGGLTGSSQVILEADQASSFYIGTSPACPIIFAQSRVEVARIDTSGNLGIGMTPVQVIDVTKTRSSPTIINLTNAHTAGTAQYQANASTAAIIMAALGSTVGGTTYGGLTGSSQVVLEASNASSFYIGTNGAAPIIFAQNRVEVARIDTSGNLGVGMTPVNPIDVTRALSSVPKIAILNSNSGGGAGLSAIANVASLVLNALGSAIGGTTYGGVTGNSQIVLEAEACSSFYIGTGGGTAPIIFAQNRIEVARFYTAGGIGINAPSQSLFTGAGFPILCGLTDSGGRGIRIGTSDYNNTNTGSFLQLEFAAGTGNTSVILKAFTAGGTAAGTIALNSNGGTVSVGGLVDASAAAAGQFKFPSSQNASANANTLDDYSEGTWTPSVGGSATYIAQTGTYTKIGRLVFVRASITINAIGSGSNVNITGLPFAVASGDHNLVVGYFASIATSVVWLTVSLSGSTAALFSTTAAVATLTQNAILQNGARVEFSGCYETT